MTLPLILEILDATALVTGKFAKWFNIQGRRVCFLIWIGVTFYWMFVDFYRGFISQGAFCIVSLCFHAYGYFNWKKKGIGR